MEAPAKRLLVPHFDGEHYEVPMALGAESVDELSCVVMAEPLFVLDVTKVKWPPECRSKHVVVLQSPEYDRNGKKVPVRRAYGVLLVDGRAGGRDDEFIFRQVPNGKMLDDWRQKNSFGSIIGSSNRLGHVLPVNLEKRVEEPVESRRSDAIKAKCAAYDVVEGLPPLPTSDQVDSELKRPSEEDPEFEHPEFEDPPELWRAVKFANHTWKMRNGNIATLQWRSSDYLLAARILQREGYTVYITGGDYPLSIQPLGKAVSKLQRQKDIYGEVLNLGLNARPMPVLYPRTFEIVRSLGVIKCVPGLLKWLWAARSKLDDPSRPGAIAKLIAENEAGMEAPVTGALGVDLLEAKQEKLKRQLLSSRFASDDDKSGGACWASIRHQGEEKLVRVEDIVPVDGAHFFILQEFHTTSSEDEVSFTHRKLAVRDNQFEVLRLGRAAVDHAANIITNDEGKLPSGYSFSGRTFEEILKLTSRNEVMYDMDMYSIASKFEKFLDAAMFSTLMNHDPIMAHSWALRKRPRDETEEEALKRQQEELKQQLLDGHVASGKACWASIRHNREEKLVRVEDIVPVGGIHIVIFQELRTTSVRTYHTDENGNGYHGDPVVVAHNAVRDEVKFEYRTLAVRDDDFKVLRLGQAAVDHAASETGELPSGHRLSGRDYEMMYQMRLSVFTAKRREAEEGDGEESSDED